MKIQKLQTNLDIWRSRDLTLFGRILIIKSLGISELVYCASNVDVLEEVINNKEWLRKGICSVQHLVDENGKVLEFDGYRNKYSLSSTNFLQYFQVVSSIPKQLRIKAKTMGAEHQMNCIDSPVLPLFISRTTLC